MENGSVLPRILNVSTGGKGVVRFRLHTCYPRGNAHGIHSREGRKDPRVDLDAVKEKKISFSFQESNSDSSVNLTVA
jgi:hypothetical protein